MRNFLPAALLISAGTAAVPKPHCPVYGPLFPAPKHMKNHPLMLEAVKEMDALFDERVNSNRSYSFHFEAYSTEEGPLWSRSWTAAQLQTANTTGVKVVDRNTVHRVGSITKTFTVLTFLSQVGWDVWNHPITKYIPELKALEASQKGKSPIYNVDWDDITIGSLITFQSGLMRDYSILGELTQEVPQWKDVVTDWGFPLIVESEAPPCGKERICSKKEFLEGMAKTPPFYPPYQTPMYNNIGYVLLSLVAEAITGRPFMKMIEETIIKPLKLNYTFIQTPDDSLGIIPGDRMETLWARDFGNEAATGQIFTSAGDMTTLGRHIMKSTLLKPSSTRQWLKPISFLPDPAGAVGMPWGIRQIAFKDDYQYVTSFNKAGRVGGYASLMAVLPDVNMGWSATAAGKMPETLTGFIADEAARRFLRVWQDVAREEAQTNYGGRYAAAAAGFNSSLEVQTFADQPGIQITSWLSNGTDMRVWGVTFGQALNAEDLAKLRPNVTLYPTGLEETLADGGKKVVFRAVFENMVGEKVSNSYVTDCITWIYTNAIYGSKPLDLFVFTLDRNGKATAVENEALRAKLDKVPSAKERLVR